jgi:hypothetical protein
MYGGTADNTVTGQSVCLVSSSPASNTALVLADYAVANWGTTEYATRIAGTSWASAAYNDFALDAGGMAFISKTGVTKFGLRFSGDLDNSAPTYPGGSGEKDFYAGGFTADTALTTTDPKLVVVHASASVANRLMIIGVGV